MAEIAGSHVNSQSWPVKADLSFTPEGLREDNAVVGHCLKKVKNGFAPVFTSVKLETFIAYAPTSSFFFFVCDIFCNFFF